MKKIGKTGALLLRLCESIFTTAHCANQKVGECNSLRGTLDGVLYNLFTLKEPDYLMKLMSAYRGLMVPSNQKESKGVWKESGETKTANFHYTE